MSSFASTNIDWKETDTAHVFKADVPCLKKDQVKVEVKDDRVLQISGERSREREEKGDTWHQVERSSGKFMRRFRLPENAEVGQLKAVMENGVLTVTVPKVEELVWLGFYEIIENEPNSLKDKVGSNTSLKTKKDVGSTSLSEASQRKLPETQSFLKALPVSAYCCSCILEFDGAAKGNPGPAGAGVVLRAVDGSQVYRVREGLGVATNNVAEYRALILGLRYALDKGFRHIRAYGDSKLVCMQVNGLWKTKIQNMAELCKVAKELKDKFLSSEICHVEREYNSEADAQANLGVHLQNGEVRQEVDMKL